jgi:hypothetical protein
MQPIMLPMLFALALGCGPGAHPAMATDTVDGHTYSVTVRASYHDGRSAKFEDCFSFASGVLTIRGLGEPEIYRHDELNTQLLAWQAATPFPHPFVISFHGTTAGFDGQVIYSNGVNEYGDTFILEGVAVPSCPPAAVPGANPYKQ